MLAIDAGDLDSLGGVCLGLSVSDHRFNLRAERSVLLLGHQAMDDKAQKR